MPLGLPAAAVQVCSFRLRSELQLINKRPLKKLFELFILMSPTFFNVKRVNRTEGSTALAPCGRSFLPVGAPLRNGFSCRAQIHQPFQVPTHTFELQFQAVGFAAHISYPPVARAPFPPAKDLLDFTPDRTEQPVRPHGRRAQLLPAAGLAQYPVGHAVLPAPFTAGLAPIRLVGHHHRLVTPDHGFKFLAVMHVGRTQRHLPDQRVGFVHRHMRLVTVMRQALLDRVTGIPVTTSLISLGRRAAGRLQQRRVHQRAGFQNQALGLKLPVDQAQQVFVQAVFAQPFAEIDQRGFIGHPILPAQPDKAPPAPAVGDLFLALRIGQAVAMLQQAHLEEHQGRAGRPTGRRRIHRLQRLFQGAPVQCAVEPFQKVVGRGRWHQAVQKSKLRIRGRMHVFQTSVPAPRSKQFFRGLNK